jgi:hypothetical protein
MAFSTSVKVAPNVPAHEGAKMRMGLPSKAEPIDKTLMESRGGKQLLKQSMAERLTFRAD